MANTTELRQGSNTINVEGILAEKNLELKQVDEYVDGQKTGNKKNVIQGDLKVKIGEGSYITLKVNASEKTKNGSESKAYKGFKTIMEQHQSIIDTKDETTADKVTALGKVTMNDYFSEGKNAVVSYTQYACNTMSRVKNIDTYSPKAEVELEVFYKGMKDEKKKNSEGEMEETGRKILDVVLPEYGGKVIPLAIIVEDDEAIEFFEDLDKNVTIVLYCELVNKTVVTTKGGSGKGGFGKKHTKTFTNTINEIVCRGAEDPIEFEDDEEDCKAYNPKLIKKALQAREEMLKEKEEKGKNGDSSTSDASSSKKSFPSKKKDEKPVEDDIDDDDLPF